MRKCLIFWFIILLHFLSPALGQDVGSDWNLVRNENEVKTWQLRSNSDVTGTLQTNYRKREIDWSKIKKNAFFKALETKKKKLLSLLGISDWSVDDYIWKNNDKTTELSVSGLYKDSFGQAIEFYEVHIFKGKKTSQVLFTQPIRPKLGSNLRNKFFADVRRHLENE